MVCAFPTKVVVATIEPNGGIKKSEGIKIFVVVLVMCGKMKLSIMSSSMVLPSSTYYSRGGVLLVQPRPVLPRLVLAPLLLLSSKESQALLELWEVKLPRHYLYRYWFPLSLHLVYHIHQRVTSLLDMGKGECCKCNGQERKEKSLCSGAYATSSQIG